MDPMTQLLLLLLSIHVLLVATVTDPQDLTALNSLKDIWKNVPRSWKGADPCGDRWEGIGCSGSRVTFITLASANLTGTLSGDLSSLSELQMLDLSYNKDLTGSLPQSIGDLKKLTNLILVGCGFTGPIPDEIGSLQELLYLSLNSNGFSGPIPASIGNLSKLYWLDLADNKLSGTIPVSKGTTPGLDMLVGTKHFHLGQNQLSGPIPSKLFSINMTLIHLLLDDNRLDDVIPSSLGDVQGLEVLRLDRNSLSGQVPSTINNLVGLHELHLSNNNLTGLMPNLTGMNLLNYLDLSNNSFDISEIPPWLSSLPSLTSAILRKDQINGTLDLGEKYNYQLQVLDLQGNEIAGFTQRGGNNIQIILADNPLCKEESQSQENYCTTSQQTNSTYSTQARNCNPVPCQSNKISSPNCRCSHPYTGILVFRAPTFPGVGNVTYYNDLEETLMKSFQSEHLPVESVSLSNPNKDASDYLNFGLAVFPYGQESFNITAIAAIGFVLSNQIFKPPKDFGPFYFIATYTGIFVEPKKSSSMGIIIGAAAGGSVLVLLLLFAGVYAFSQKKRAEKANEQINPFASWDPNKISGNVPVIRGARNFSFEELKRYTNNFSEVNDVGSGGYGKVYRGTPPNGQLIAIKRAQHGSMQGALEFKTEIELLSRVHHKNLVSLVGFCFDQGEQMLVYEYIPNGTLRDSLSGKSGIRLDWMRRLKVALGSARGLAYLHELADPPIIHRDIKSNNILLDDRLNAKVADFGLSKLVGDSEKGHVTTQVKGTMGYLDPEYYMTNQLTEKSDVYSYGVVMLELITARSPIEKGKYIVREVKIRLDKTKDLYNLHEILDPAIGLGTSLGGFERFVDLALRCVEESGAERPTMGEVVKEIEEIMQLAGMNPNAESTSSSASYEGANKGPVHHPYTNEGFLDYSGGYIPHKVEPK